MKKIKRERYILCLSDCIEAMKTMKDNTVDVCFTSPPYNVSWQSKTGKPFCKQKYLYKEDNKEYFDLLVNSTEEMLRVAKKYVIVNIQKNCYNKIDVYKYIGQFSREIHDIIIWCKTNPTPSSNKGVITNSYEMFILLKCDGVKYVKANSNNLKNYFVSSVNSGNKYKDIHRAVMKQNISDMFIKEFTKEHDVVLDPFCGMSTTGVSCLKYGRRYIGIDNIQEYITESDNRLKNINKF